MGTESRTYEILKSSAIPVERQRIGRPARPRVPDREVDALKSIEFLYEKYRCLNPTAPQGGRGGTPHPGSNVDTLKSIEILLEKQ